jgi:hypothetical protein
MTVAALVDRFAEIGVTQDEPLLESQIAKFSRLFDAKIAITEELRSRDGDQRRALTALFRHPNMQVRLNAAKATPAGAPQKARDVLEQIAASNHYPQCGDAGMSLWNLDRGVFKPT